MSIVKKIIKWIGLALTVPILYILFSLLFSWITIDRQVENQVLNKTIYLSSNGVHLDVILPKGAIDSLLLNGTQYTDQDKYFAFGWGDKDFFIKTPTWGDLTFNTAFKALFLKSTTLMHITKYTAQKSDWIAIHISDSEMKKLNDYILKSFKVDKNKNKIILKNEGYSSTDNFYEAEGSYSFFKTCNTWLNTGFKESGLKACFWTPFDFGLLNKYEK